MQTHRPAIAPRASAAATRSPLEPLAYGIADAVAVSGLSRSTLYRRAAEGLLRMFRVGGRRLVDAASLRALLGTNA